MGIDLELIHPMSAENIKRKEWGFQKKKLLIVVNVDWFFLSHRLPIALDAQKAGFEVHIATAVTDRLNIIENFGLKVHPLSMLRNELGLLNSFKTLLELRRIFNDVKPHIVHLVTIKPVLMGGLLARWLRVPALVSAVSGLGYVFIAKGFAARFRRLCVICIYSLAFKHRNQIVIFQNPDDRERLIASAGLSKIKTVIIRGSGVDLTKFVVKPEVVVPPVVLFPARLLADKGLFEFIAAAELLKVKGLSARFVLAGLVDLDNPTSVSNAQLSQWIESGLVEYWGYMLDMPQVIANASVVVLPSYREGLPKVLLEAAASGRAVVTTDVPGCRDAIEPGVTGLLVPVRDAKSLALAIEHLLANSEQRTAMGLAGRRLAEKEFDVRAVIDKHLTLYARLLD